MRRIVCLVSDPEICPLKTADARALASICGESVRWLASEEALEAEVAAADDALRSDLIELVGQRAIDWAVIPAEGRRKRLLLADMDSTIITTECIDELADYLGLRAQVAAITRRAMEGELDFADALRERVAMLEGLHVGVVDQICRSRIRLTPGATALVGTMRVHGAFTALVSGGFTLFTRYVRGLAGLDHDEGNVLEIAEERLTGKIVEPIRDRSAKVATLDRLVVDHGLKRSQALSLGDGANDAAMLSAVGLGVGYRPHRVAAEAAHAVIQHTTLVTALFFQGYARSDFVEP